MRYGYTFLGQKQAFMYKLLPVLIENMGGAYPELNAQKELIAKVIKEEEDSFLRTLETGIRLLDKTMADAKQPARPKSAVKTPLRSMIRSAFRSTSPNSSSAKTA